MARTWLSVRVDLVSGHGRDLWPRPGRLLLARPGMTFAVLAEAIETAFGRWDRAHLHRFTLADGSSIGIDPWGDDEHLLDSTATTMFRLRLGEQLSYEFDLGDSWMHLLTVADQRVDPLEVHGAQPDVPVAYFGWGELPDQYGRRWDGDDGEGVAPPRPEPPLGDLPDLHPWWGSRAYPSTPPPSDVERDAIDDAPVDLGEPTWEADHLVAVRGAAFRGDVAELVELVGRRDVLVAAHTVAPTLLAAADADRPNHLLAGLVDPLHARGWPGDVELADEIERVVLDRAGDVDLRAVPVELDELDVALDSSTDMDAGHTLFLDTGEIWPSDMDDVEEWDEDRETMVVLGLGTAFPYQDMVGFAERVDDAALSERLSAALDGRGAFGRFGRELDEEDVWRARWLWFRDERRRARARWWLADRGLRPRLADEQRRP